MRRTRIADIAIIHFKTSLSVIAGEACLALTKPCLRKATDMILLPRQGKLRSVPGRGKLHKVIIAKLGKGRTHVGRIKGGEFGNSTNKFRKT